MRSFFLAALLVAGVVAGGCRGTREMTMTVTGEQQLNDGNAAIVRIYQLSNTTNFRGTPIEAFWQNDVGALGSEYVSHQQLLLYPGQTEPITLTPEETTQYIGIAADLRQPDQEGWRQIYPLSDLLGKEVSVSVGSNRLSVNVR